MKPLIDDIEPREYKSLKIYDETHSDLTRLIAILTLQRGEPVRIVHVMDELVRDELHRVEREIGERL